MGNQEDYIAKAAEALEQLDAATTEAERVRLRRARGVYLKLAAHDGEAAARAAAAPPKRIVPEKPAPAKPGPSFRII
ncbi:MAG TPA: hypothetical protein VFF61_00060 [Microvirga sp.]|jgi:hypothetical protein|nr:hypothetical protein [Microvirga sp.]